MPKAKTYDCPRCGKTCAREDRRRKEPLRAAAGCALHLWPKEAPRVKCACGNTVVILKGEL